MSEMEKKAARYDYLRRKVCVIGGTTSDAGDVQPDKLEFINLPPSVGDWHGNSAAVLLDIAIDAAMAAAPAAGGEQS